MLQNDRRPLLKRGAAERMAVELASMSQLHKNMGMMYRKHGFEEAQYIENVQAGMYRKFYREMKGLSE